MRSPKTGHPWANVATGDGKLGDPPKDSP
jgi:hypothetical protein